MSMFNQRQHIANIITISRILGVGLIFWMTPYNTNLWLFITVSIYAVICITDFVDGWIARKLKIVTDLGKVLDPLADKILVLVFLPLLEMQLITSFPVFIILSREFAIMALRIVASNKQGTIIAAQWSGKFKTILTLPLCGILFARAPVTLVDSLPIVFVPLEFLRQWIISWPEWFISVLIYTVVIVTIWSFLDYFGQFIWQQYIHKFNNDEKKAKKALLSLIPNTFSLLNLFCGLTAVVLAWYEQYQTAALLVLIGILLDGIDGSIARKLDAQSSFGAKLDSKADNISFGLVPSIVVYRLLSQNAGFDWAVISFFVALLYYASVLYRLHRFEKGGHSSTFDGLPCPIGAGLVIVSAISIYLSSSFLFIFIIVFTSVLMISRIPYPHFNIGRKKRFFKVLNITGVTFTFLTICKLLDLPYARNIYAYEVLFLVIIIYILSPLGYVGQRLFKRS